MRRTDAAAWVISVCAGSLRLSQAKTLAVLVAGALSVQRVSLANIGRALLGNVKHQIKRCWRFCANDRVEPADAMRGVVKKVLRSKRNKPLLVSFDWTDVRGFSTLMASVVFKGRRADLLGQLPEARLRRAPQPQRLRGTRLRAAVWQISPRSSPAVCPERAAVPGRLRPPQRGTR